VQWYTGALVHWCTGARVHWYTGALVHWCTGARVHWCTGAYTYTALSASHMPTSAATSARRRLPTAGLNPSPTRFLRFLGILTLESFSSAALGLTVGAFAPSTEAAVAIGPAVMVVFIVFGGGWPGGGCLREGAVLAARLWLQLAHCALGPDHVAGRQLWPDQ
jgi:hypothetical protein